MGLVVLLRPGPFVCVNTHHCSPTVTLRSRLGFQGWGAGPPAEEPGPEPIQALLVAHSDAATLPSTCLIIAI